VTYDEEDVFAEYEGCHEQVQCTPNDGIKNFPAGKAYSYKYNVKAVSEMRGASDQQSSLALNARVVIHAESACEYALRVTYHPTQVVLAIIGYTLEFPISSKINLFNEK